MQICQHTLYQTCLFKTRGRLPDDNPPQSCNSHGGFWIKKTSAPSDTAPLAASGTASEAAFEPWPTSSRMTNGHPSKHRPKDATTNHTQASDADASTTGFSKCKAVGPTVWTSSQAQDFVKIRRASGEASPFYCNKHSSIPTCCVWADGTHVL